MVDPRDPEEHSGEPDVPPTDGAAARPVEGGIGDTAEQPPLEDSGDTVERPAGPEQAHPVDPWDGRDETVVGGVPAASPPADAGPTGTGVLPAVPAEPPDTGPATPPPATPRWSARAQVPTPGPGGEDDWDRPGWDDRDERPRSAVMPALIAAAVVILLAIIGLGVYLALNNRNTPTPTPPHHPAHHDPADGDDSRDDGHNAADQYPADDHPTGHDRGTRCLRTRPRRRSAGTDRSRAGAGRGNPPAQFDRASRSGDRHSARTGPERGSR